MILCDECLFFPKPDHPIWKESFKTGFAKCLQGQPMPFKLPSSPTDKQWGFHKKECGWFLPKPDGAQKKSPCFASDKNCDTCKLDCPLR